jgi:hypothetical protein
VVVDGEIMGELLLGASVMRGWKQRIGEVKAKNPEANPVSAIDL